MHLVAKAISETGLVIDSPGACHNVKWVACC